jgi:short-subunit dehydrogenase
VIAADLGDPRALAEIEAKLRTDASITMLVNNAGVGTHKPLLESDVDAMTRMIDLNVTALTRLTYAAARASSRAVTARSSTSRRSSRSAPSC